MWAWPCASKWVSGLCAGCALGEVGAVGGDGGLAGLSMAQTLPELCMGVFAGGNKCGMMVLKPVHIKISLPVFKTSSLCQFQPIN
jgi:hypothetical protein